MFLAESLILVFIAGICNGLMDLISFHWHKAPDWMRERPSFWNPQISWKNKWKGGQKQLGERFLGSSTLFVFLTDGWHLLKSLMLLSLITIPSLLILNTDKLTLVDSIITYVVLRAMFALGFYVTYK